MILFLGTVVSGWFCCDKFCFLDPEVEFSMGDSISLLSTLVVRVQHSLIGS